MNTKPRIAPLQRFIFGGLIKTISTEFKSEGLLLSLANPPEQAFRSASSNIQQQGYFISLQPTGVDLRGSRGNSGVGASIRPHALSYEGRKTIGTENEDQPALMADIKLVPVEFKFNLWFGTTDINHLLNFYTTWAFVQAYDRLNFNVDYLGQVLPIESELSDSLAIPEKTRDSGVGNLIFEGEIATSGFLSHDDPRDIWIYPTIKETDLQLDVLG